jgi:hypothetical protein
MVKASVPFLKPSFNSTYVTCESIKLRVTPSPTLRLVTQAAMGATPWWFKLGPRLCESLKAHVEGHVILPHFRDVNVLVDVTLGWPPLALPPISLFWPNGGSYFLIKGAHLHCVFVFSVQKVLLGVSFIFTQCVHFASFSNPPYLNIFSRLWSPLWIWFKSSNHHIKRGLQTRQ